mgnify:CR=1 FL=1
MVIHYSGAIETWGLTIPQFSRGRYIAGREVELYNVGYLFPPPIILPVSLHRCVFVYNPTDNSETITLDVQGPYPTDRPETFYLALGSSAPTFYVDYLEDEQRTPPIVGGWATSLELSVPAKSAFPVWLRLSFASTSAPTKDAYFVLRFNAQPVSYIIYSYQQNVVVLPSTLWQAIRAGGRLGSAVTVSGTTPPPIYTPAGYLLSTNAQVNVTYPLVDNFAESDFGRKVISVVANAIAEFWLRADASARLSEDTYLSRADAMTLFGAPQETLADALAHLTSVVTTLRGDALVHLAVSLIERLGDALTHLGLEQFPVKGDALVYLGTEWIKRGDTLTFFAIDAVQRRGDADVRLLTVDDILDLSPLPSSSVWGASLIPPLSQVTVTATFDSGVLHATCLIEGSRVRALYSSDGIFWQPLGIIPIYSNKLQRAIGRGFVRFRNERDDWTIVVWAVTRGG